MTIALSVATAAPAPGSQGLTATYVARMGGEAFKMKVEVAANGDLRGDLGVAGVSMIRRGGRTYYIVPGADGPLVEDVEDVGAVMREKLVKMDRQLCQAVREAGPPAKLVSRGTVTVEGRPGEAFSTPANKNARPDVVISRDRALAPLGAAMAAQFRLTQTLLGRCGPDTAHSAQMQALLDSGAPLQIGPMKLDTVDYGAVDPARFVLPAAPASREIIRAEMIRQGHSPAVAVIRRPN